MKNIIRILITTLTISIGYLPGVLASQTNSQFAAIIDAGSTGSRVYVYKYNKSENKKLLKITLLGSKKIKPGLSTLAGHPDKADKYILPLISYTEILIPKSQKANFYLLATAGMRIMPAQQQKNIYKKIKTYLNKSNKFNIKQITTISGKKEGLFDWLALNYLNKTLQPGKTIGALDMGGGSTEIAYITNENTAPGDIVNISINGNNYRLYSKSYLGLGLNFARYQYSNHTNCFPKNYPLPNDQKALGNAEQCISELNSLVNETHRVNIKTPPIPKNKKIYALSGFYYTFTAKSLHLGTNTTLNTLKSSAKNFCESDWNTLTKTYPKDKHLFAQCFNAALSYSLLANGYKLDKSEQIYAKNKIKNQEISWTLGAAIVDSIKTNNE